MTFYCVLQVTGIFWPLGKKCTFGKELIWKEVIGNSKVMLQLAGIFWNHIWIGACRFIDLGYKFAEGDKKRISAS